MSTVCLLGPFRHLNCTLLQGLRDASLFVFLQSSMASSVQLDFKLAVPSSVKASKIGKFGQIFSYFLPNKAGPLFQGPCAGPGLAWMARCTKLSQSSLTLLYYCRHHDEVGYFRNDLIAFSIVFFLAREHAHVC